MGGRGEEAFVAWLRRRTGATTFIGDDAAELAAGGRLVVTVDQQIEGTHFISGLDPKLLGRRLLRVNLSDLAACGATPRWALLALGVPPEVDPRRVVEGVLLDAKKFGVALAGGDVAHSELITTSLTLVGEKGKRDAPRSRDRARPGQTIWLAGSVGESALGCELLLRGATASGRAVRLPQDKRLQIGKELQGPGLAAVRHNLLPTPRLEVGRWLAALGPRRAGACIDVSDGLAKDLRRICDASGVGCELDLRLVRKATSPRFEELARALGLDPIATALAGGEDYALLFTLPAKVVPPAQFGAVPVGVMTRARAISFLDRDGSRSELPRLGWDHLSPPTA